jgi:hypothetical protein
MRCVYPGNGATLAGLTLTNGYDSSGNGGGVYCRSTNAALSDCVLGGNSASGSGGGSYSGTLSNCTFIRNSAANGGGRNGGILSYARFQ